jgi:hypothetical protein
VLVTATVVAYLVITATPAPGFVTTQHSSATGFDSLECFKDLNRRLVFVNKVIMMDIDNVCYLMVRLQRAFS